MMTPSNRTKKYNTPTDIAKDLRICPYQFNVLEAQYWLQPMGLSRFRVSEMSRSTTLPGVIIRAYFARRRRLDRENEAEAIRSRNEAAMAAATNTATASARSAESTSTAVERPASNYYGYEEEEEFGVNLVPDGDRLDNHPSTWSRRGSIEGDEEDDAEAGARFEYLRFPICFQSQIHTPAELTPLNDLHKLRQTCPEFENLCRHRPELHDKLYITDSEIVYQWARKKLFVYCIFNIVFWLFRWLFDDESFNPTWHSVLYVDDIVKNRRPIFIKNTLVVHCQSIRAFEKLIPFICGSFTRLTIHGHVIKLNQLKRLLLDNVKQVKITARISIQPDEYDDAVQLVLGQVRDKWFNFHLLSNPQLMPGVRTACINHETLMVGPSNVNSCNVQHRKRPLDIYFFGVLHLFLVINQVIKQLGWFSDSGVFSVYFYFVIIFDFFLKCLFFVVVRSKPTNVVCF